MRRLITLTLTLVVVSSAAIVGTPETLSPKKLRWPKGAIIVSLSTSLTQNPPSIVPGSDVVAALTNAMNRWEMAADVDFEVAITTVDTVSPFGGNGDGVSIVTSEPSIGNIALFADQNAKAAAITRVFFNSKNEITEADIVLNPYSQFSSDGTPGTFDLERVFTHELGHVLGLEHSFLSSSIMFADIPINSSSANDALGFRLASSDVNRVRSIYGNGSSTDECCRKLSGLIANPANLQGSMIVVDTSSGTVVDSVGTDIKGRFSLDGLPTGRYDVWFSPFDREGEQFEDLKIASGLVLSEESKTVRSEHRPRTSNFQITRIGSNGALSTRPVRIRPGEINRLWIAGPGIASPGVVVGFSSTEINLVAKKNVSSDYAGAMDVLIVEFRAAISIPRGNHSIFIENPGGMRKYLFGALSVE